MRKGYVISNVPYQPIWKEEYEAEKEKLEAIFGDAVFEIEHIGATAVEGLSSKPIIDIAVMINSYKDADAFTEPLAEIDYEFEPPRHPGIPERHFFFKYNPNKFHLSVAYTDRGGYWPRQILFRDYLRAHPEAREEYARLKEELLEKDPSGEAYTSGKTDFVNKILKLAGHKVFQLYQGPKTEAYPSATEVVPQEDFKLAVTFENGEHYAWDMTSYLGKWGFQPIETYEDFKTAHVVKDAIVWDCGVVLDPNSIYHRLKLEKSA